jgi:hypothetical protein
MSHQRRYNAVDPTKARLGLRRRREVVLIDLKTTAALFLQSCQNAVNWHIRISSEKLAAIKSQQ